MKKIYQVFALTLVLAASETFLTAQSLNAVHPKPVIVRFDGSTEIVQSFWKSLFKEQNAEQLRNLTTENIVFKDALGTGFIGQEDLESYLKTFKKCIVNADIDIKNIHTNDNKMVVKSRVFGKLASGKYFSYNMSAIMTLQNNKVTAVESVGDIEGVTALQGNLSSLERDLIEKKLNEELDHLMPDGVWH